MRVRLSIPSIQMESFSFGSLRHRLYPRGTGSTLSERYKDSRSDPCGAQKKGISGIDEEGPVLVHYDDDYSTLPDEQLTKLSRLGVQNG